MKSTRRHWLSTWATLAASPGLLSALEHSRSAIESWSAHLETIDSTAAVELETLTAQIIPSTDGPGAREAGVIYFIDRALSTFVADDLQTYRTGLQELQQKRQELFPKSTTFAALDAEPQSTLIREIEGTGFFELLRTHTVLGFLGDPSYAGNRGGVGWQQIGFEHRMSYQHPFGFYDREEMEKTGAAQ